MPYTCSVCGSLQNGEEPDDRLCPACREDTLFLGDWREPLYRCARRLQAGARPEQRPELARMLLLLGDYRDCAGRYERLTQALRLEYALAVSDVESPASTIMRVEEGIKRLRALNFPDSGPVIARAEQRLAAMREEERFLREAFLQSERNSRLIRFAAVFAFCAALAAFILYQGHIAIPAALREADSLMAAGRYEQALPLYQDSETLWHTDAAAEGARRAHLAIAKHHLDEGLYAQAIALYATYDEDERVNEAYRLWSDALAAEGNAAQAISMLSRTPESDARSARMAQLYMQYAGEAAASAVAAGDIETAREMGASIPLLDPQLRYCRLLFEAGFDLEAVYPDGVAVTDAPVARYQLPDGAQAGIAPPGGAPDLSRALIFERCERSMFSSGAISLPFLPSAERDPLDESIYNVRLLPGAMFSGPLPPANSLAEATAVVLVDGVYRKAGAIPYRLKTEATEYKGVRLPGVESIIMLPYFSALTSVAVYDKANPQVCLCLEYAEAKSPCETSASLALHPSGMRVAEAVPNRCAEMDLDPMRRALRRALDALTP